jgi:hypothetical protein
MNLTQAVPKERWDSTAIMGCVCDAGYGGFDCSERMTFAY